MRNKGLLVDHRVVLDAHSSSNSNDIENVLSISRPSIYRSCVNQEKTVMFVVMISW